MQGILGRVQRGLRRRHMDWTRRARELSPRDYGRLVDYHIHTRLCGHAVGEPEDYVREAMRKGLREIGFSDHMPLLRIRDEHLTMAPGDLPRYAAMVRDVQESVDDLVIRFGIEMDYIPDQMDEVWEAASPYDFDYVYGAVHYIDGWGFSDSRRLSSYRDKNPDEMYERYYEIFCEAAEEGGFDVMAHPDLVKKHGVRTRRPLERFYREAADALARGGVAIEMNTSGIRKPSREVYPAPAFLDACVERGVPVTLGSDAHSPGQVGMDFDVAIRMLERAGVKEIATFEARRRTMRPLDTAPRTAEVSGED